jgi:hypothetical protein
MTVSRDLPAVSFVVAVIADKFPYGKPKQRPLHVSLTAGTPPR